MEDWFGLTTKTGLLGIVAALSLGVEGVLPLFVLGYFVKTVLLALLRDAESLTGFWNENHCGVRGDCEREWWIG